MTSQATGGTPNRAVHGVIVVVGMVALVALALPVAFDGLLNTDRFAVAFLVVSGTALAAVGGLAEGLALRAGYRALALGCLAAFTLVAVYPPGLMSGRWFASQREPGSSEALGVAGGVGSDGDAGAPPRQGDRSPCAAGWGRGSGREVLSCDARRPTAGRECRWMRHDLMCGAASTTLPQRPGFFRRPCQIYSHSE